MNAPKALLLSFYEGKEYSLSVLIILHRSLVRVSRSAQLCLLSSVQWRVCGVATSVAPICHWVGASVWSQSNQSIMPLPPHRYMANNRHTPQGIGRGTWPSNRKNYVQRVECDIVLLAVGSSS